MNNDTDSLAPTVQQLSGSSSSSSPGSSRAEALIAAVCVRLLRCSLRTLPTLHGFRCAGSPGIVTNIRSSSSPSPLPHWRRGPVCLSCLNWEVGTETCLINPSIQPSVQPPSHPSFRPSIHPFTYLSSAPSPFPQQGSPFYRCAVAVTWPNANRCRLEKVRQHTGHFSSIWTVRFTATKTDN